MAQKKHTKKTIYKKLTNPSLQLAVALVVLLITVQLSRQAPMLDWEVALFRYIYGWPESLRLLFFVITQFGSIYVLMGLSLIYMARQHYHVVLRLLLSGLLAYLMSGVAKDLWGRMRPHEYLYGVTVLDYVVRGPGFPSGHTALATALGLTLAYTHKKHRILLYTLIALVGISRINLGLHAPLDVIGGFAIGWACYALFRHIALHDSVLGPRRVSAQVVTPRPRLRKKVRLI